MRIRIVTFCLLAMVGVNDDHCHEVQTPVFHLSLQVTFHKHGTASAATEDQKEMSVVDPKVQLCDECYNELLAVTKDISKRNSQTCFYLES